MNLGLIAKVGNKAAPKHCSTVKSRFSEIRTRYAHTTSDICISMSLNINVMMLGVRSWKHRYDYCSGTPRLYISCMQ